MHSSYLCNSADLLKKLEILPLFHLERYKAAIFLHNELYYLVPTNILSHFTHIVCKSSYLCHSADMFKKLEVLPPFSGSGSGSGQPLKVRSWT